MRHTRLLALAVLTVCAVAPAPSQASWVAVSIEKRIKNADLVVVGELVATEEVSSDSHKRGKLRITAVLKGDRAPRLVAFGWSGPKTVIGPDGRESTMVHSTMIRYKKGDKGIWILRRDPKTGEYTANYPGNLMRIAGDAKGRALLAKIRRLCLEQARPGKDCVINGLEISASAKKRKFRAKEAVSVTILLTNRTGKTIKVSDSTHPFGRFRITLKGPDGKKIPGPMFKLRPPQAVTIPLLPGASYGRIYAVSNWHGVRKAGQYTFSARYAANTKKKDIWQGTLQARPLSFEVLPPPKGPDPHDGLKKIKLAKDWEFNGNLREALLALGKELNVPMEVGARSPRSFKALRSPVKILSSAGATLKAVLEKLLDPKEFAYLVEDGKVRVVLKKTVATLNAIEKERKANGLRASLHTPSHLIVRGRAFPARIMLSNVSGRKIVLTDNADLSAHFGVFLNYRTSPNAPATGTSNQLIVRGIPSNKEEVVIHLLPTAVYARSFDLTKHYIAQSRVGSYRLAARYSLPANKKMWIGAVSIPSQPLRLDDGKKAPQIKFDAKVSVATKAALGNKPKPVEIAFALDGTITNTDGAGRKVALTLDLFHLVQGATAHQIVVELATPILMTGKAWAFHLKVGTKLPLTGKEVRARMVFSDFAGNRYVVTTEKVRIVQKQAP